MGGSTEDDNAMKWFLQQADGGDVLVLRTSGANGYNSYLYSALGIPVNSVETIVCNNSLASYDLYVLQKIQNAEAIWFAGGNQWTYISYWRNTPVDSLINLGIKQRNVVVGGTSAGMAIMGQYYFTAQNGTITSSAALANPYSVNLTVDSVSFLKNQLLENVITDTHFDNPDRKGRLVAFMSRIIQDYNVKSNAIACDEYTAVCVDTNGMARVFGGYPSYDDNAYFLQVNCDLTNQWPENCSSGNPLTWDLSGRAIKVYSVKGTPNGSGSFDLKDWKNGNNGNWLEWSVDTGFLNEALSTSPICSTSNEKTDDFMNDVLFYPNPVTQSLHIFSERNSIKNCSVKIIDAAGNSIEANDIRLKDKELYISSDNLKEGIYLIMILKDEKILAAKKIIKIQ